MAMRAFAMMGSRAVAQMPRCAAAGKRQAFGGAQVVGRRWASYHFAESHEYVKVDGDVGTIGITQFAADNLGEVVFVELPEVGATFDKTDSFGSVESVKAASDVYMPVGGEITSVNEELSESQELVNNDPMGDGWFAKIKIADKGELASLMDEAAYKAFCEDSKH
ncbi:glycine cleavage system, H-protein [Tribonema minus]|uniref:Glycine cleavage system H protein n=1 Tax=Tribonema minus TaxID=303371 RepID=A0A836CGJ1_9STRA|nr:glycine cleavage system, H-protein [Tribonema minus]